ncbi:MAG: hypothetical protein LZF86_110284 [Nitrospira sp.]|nr:MAG: hypothetical protein LZF86_110284 [Nitrospira sp.]
MEEFARRHSSCAQGMEAERTIANFREGRQRCLVQEDRPIDNIDAERVSVIIRRVLGRCRLCEWVGFLYFGIIRREWP